MRTIVQRSLHGQWVLEAYLLQVHNLSPEATEQLRDLLHRSLQDRCNGRLRRRLNGGLCDSRECSRRGAQHECSAGSTGLRSALKSHRHVRATGTTIVASSIL